VSINIFVGHAPDGVQRRVCQAIAVYRKCVLLGANVVQQVVPALLQMSKALVLCLLLML
jgi:hypothetical protein